MLIDYKNVDTFVTEQLALGNDVEWETYLKTLVFYRAHPGARTASDGAWRNGQWAFIRRYDINDQGQWEVNPRDAKHTKHIRRSGS